MSGKARAFIIGNETGSKIGDWDKYLGGEIGPDGLVYAIPGSAKYVLRIDPSTEIVEPVGRALKGPFVKSSLPANQLKWLRGIRAPANGCIYGIPANANSVLKIDPAKCAPALELGDASSDGLRLLGDGEAFLRGRWKWHGAALGGDGNVYAIPCNSPHVLKVDPRNDALSLLSISCPAAEARSDAFCPRDPQKWYGGLLANDGNIYGIPMNAPSVLRISPREQRAELLPIDARASPAAEVSPSDRWKWHGGVLGADGRCIYGMPSHADAVLKIVPATGRAYALGKLPKRDTDDHGKYKYGGAVVDPTTGIVYGIPSDADGVLKIVPATCPLFDDEAAAVRPADDVVTTFAHDKIRSVTARGGDARCEQNKWQNGFFSPRDGCIYCIPCDADRVLRIVPSRSLEEEDRVEFLDIDYGRYGSQMGTFPEKQEKWEGGVLAADGAVYCVPQQSKYVLKIQPGSHRTVI